MMQAWKKKLVLKSSTTCGVGDGGAASTGERVMALLANLYRAVAPSSCCLGLIEPRSPRSNSRPV